MKIEIQLAQTTMLPVDGQALANRLAARRAGEPSSSTGAQPPQPQPHTAADVDVDGDVDVAPDAPGAKALRSGTM